MKTFLILVLLCTTITQSLGQQAHNAFTTKLEKSIQKKLKKHKVTGVSVALMIDDELVLSDGYGFSDKENGLMASQNTPYAIGSVSKLITSTAVLKLHTEGKIDIDKPYRDYVPEFSIGKHFKDDTPITVRHLLAHFAGLPRLNAKGFILKTKKPQSRILEVSEKGYLISPPGIVNQYSDWGVDLLAVLVEKVTQQNFEDYVKEQVLIPLDMNGSSYGQQNSTKSYKNGVFTPTYEYSYAGSDGLNAKAEDLVKLGQMYLKEGKSNGGQFLSQSIAQASIKPQFIDAPLNFGENQGLMWDIRKFNKYTRISKGGIHEPFYSMLYLVPEYNFVLAICSNSNSSSAIHRAIYGEVIDYLSKVKPGKPSANMAPDLNTVTLSEEKMNQLSGVYSTNEGIVNIAKSGKKFKVTFLAAGKTMVGIPYSHNTMRLKFKLLGLLPIHVMDIFLEEVNNEIVVGEQYESTGYRSLGGVKIDQSRPIPQEWKQAVGKYRVSNVSADEHKTIEEIELKINDYGILEVSGRVIYPNKFPLQLALSPISAHQAIIPGYSFDFFAGETVELSQEDGKARILISGFEFEKIE